MRPLGSHDGLGWVAVASLVAGAACGPQFVAGTGNTGGGGTGAGTSSTGGTGSGPSTGGASGCTPGSCAADQYCDTGNAQCVGCSKLDRFSFGAAVGLGVTVPAAGASELYPRADPGTGDLYLVQQEQGSTHLNQIARAPFMVGKTPWTSASLLMQISGNHQDSGPFPLQDPSELGGLVSDGIAKLSTPVLLFDSDRLGEKHVFAVDLKTSASSQLTLPGGSTHETRIAVATDASPPRFFWIGNPGGSTTDRLLTATASDTAPTPVTITLESGCPTPLPNTPWVTPGGDRLLFTSANYGPPPGCTSPDTTATHLYEVPLDASGQPTDKARRVFPNDSSIDTTPSLTPNRCALIFARVESSGVKLYAASRN